MTDNQSKTSIVRVVTTQISRYSNSLIKRAVDEIALKSPQMVRPAAIRKRILVTGYPGEIGECLAAILPLEGFDAKPIASVGPPFNEIFSELSENKYDMVIVSYWPSWQVLLEIRQRFPKIKTIFLNSYKYKWDAIAKQHGVDAIIRVPFEYEDLLSRINKIFFA